MSRLVIGSFLAGILVAAVLVLWRGFFWQHALIIGIAVTALVYSTGRTIDRLRNIHKP